MSPEASLPPNPAEVFVPFDDYVIRRPQFFPSPSSPSYFLRWQRRILLETGVLLSTTQGDLARADLLDIYILALSKAGKNFQADELHSDLRKFVDPRSTERTILDSFREIPF